MSCDLNLNHHSQVQDCVFNLTLKSALWHNSICHDSRANSRAGDVEQSHNKRAVPTCRNCLTNKHQTWNSIWSKTRARYENHRIGFTDRSYCTELFDIGMQSADTDALPRWDSLQVWAGKCKTLLRYWILRWRESRVIWWERRIMRFQLNSPHTQNFCQSKKIVMTAMPLRWSKWWWDTV